MPIQRYERESVPYVRPAYEPDTRTLAQLMAMAGQARAQDAGRRGQASGQNWMTLGQIISSGIQSHQDQKLERARLEASALRQQQEDAFKLRDQNIRAAEAAARIGEREEAGQLRQDAALERSRSEAYKRGGDVAEQVGYGPMSELQLDDVLQGPAAGRAQYTFGPGTAEGPELLPTRQQQRAIEDEKAVAAAGGRMIDGRPWMPPKPEREANPTEYSLALLAEGDDPVKARAAARALARVRALRQDREGGAGAPIDAPIVGAPTDPNSQDIMGQAGLSYNGFMALTNPTRLPRDQRTRNAAAQEVQAWARQRGIDVATFQSQYKALNEVLEANINRFNTVQNIEGELVGSVANLKKAAEASGLNDVRAINAAKLWLKDELNDPNASDYAFSLNALVSDIARYNAASSGRAPLESDMAEARRVVQRGIASGSLTGLESAVNRSVANMGTVMQDAVNRSSKGVWSLFGVGDKFKPVNRGGSDKRGSSDPLSVTAPNGQVFSFPTTEAAAAFRARIGGK